MSKIFNPTVVDEDSVDDESQIIELEKMRSQIKRQLRAEAKLKKERKLAKLKLRKS